MPLWPAAKMMDMVIGLDFHTTFIPPSPLPIPWVPHPYFGPIYLWHTPTFPKFDTFINNMPACTVGSMGYYLHIPILLPCPPSMLNLAYWKRYLTNIPMVLTLTGLTIAANLAIAGISAMIPKPKSAEGFISEVTGIDTSSASSTWSSIVGTFSAYTKWATWIKLLMPPIPYPGAQGSTAVGSPNVTVNGGPLAFVAPLVATSCSDLPVVPNAMTVGFSNVLVGVSIGDIIKALLVNAIQDLIQEGLKKGLEDKKNRKSNGC